MKLKDIKTIDDLRDYIKLPGFVFSNKQTQTIKIILKFEAERLENDFRWNIWDTSLEKTGRYPFINSIPKLMIFKQKTVDGKPYTAGIIFPVNFDSVIKSIKFDDANKTIEIEVFENAFYWRYDRNEGNAVKKIFRNYDTDVNYIIGTGATQMDSQSPSHPPFGGVEGP
jgi:hypothetical protein